MRKAIRTLQQAHGRWASWALIALAALMPLFPGLIPVLLIVSVIALVVRHEAWKGRLAVPSTWDLVMWGPLLLYALYVLGLAWTSNFDYAGFDLQIKLPLAIFPLLFLRMPGEARLGGDLLVVFFILGNALAVVLCCVRVPIHVLFGTVGWSAAVFGSDFSLFLHPSYFALYLCFSLAALLLMPLSTLISSNFRPVITAVLCLGIVLCGSKAGWACLPIVLATVLATCWKDRSLRRMVLSFFVASLIGGSLLILLSTNVRQRVAEAWHAVTVPQGKPDATTSSEERKLTWASALEVAREHAPWGVGTGDVKDELVAMYERKGYERLVQLRLNAHNQYLQTLATLGWPGIIFLCGMLLFPLVKFSMERAVLVVLFFLLNALNWAVESMLEVQAGVVFFAFMMFVLAITGRADKQDRTPISPPTA